MNFVVVVVGKHLLLKKIILLFFERTVIFYFLDPLDTKSEIFSVLPRTMPHVIQLCGKFTTTKKDFLQKRTTRSRN